ncbi:MAG: hypothetical protein ACT4PM_03760 [Gemmatimonadales bacterium]
MKVLYRGNPLANSHLRAGMAADSAAASNGAAGVARFPVKAGLWNVRLLHAAPAPDTSGEWEVFFATLVFNIATSH